MIQIFLLILNIQLDYAARSKDAAVVQECYDNIVTAIDEIFARI